MADDALCSRLDHFAAHGYHASLEQKKAFYRFARDTAAALGKPMLPINQTEWAAWHQTEQLTEARRLMLDEGRNVTEASAEVGYESLSQFIRDYRRMFGAAPKEDVLSLRRRLEK